MANNRIYAVCKDDNEVEFIQKYYPGGEGWGPIEATDKDRCSKFMTKHEDCPSNHGCAENILFVTEQDDRVKHYDFRNHRDLKIYFND